MLEVRTKGFETYFYQDGVEIKNVTKAELIFEAGCITEAKFTVLAPTVLGAIEDVIITTNIEGEIL